MSDVIRPREVRYWDEPGDPDGVVASSPEMMEELARSKRINAPGNIYQVCLLTNDSSGIARLFPKDAFATLAEAEAHVASLAAHGLATGLVILAEASRVAMKLGER